MIVDTQYMVAIYENMVGIYNLSTGHLLQELGRIEMYNGTQKFKFTTGVVNMENRNLFICAKNEKKSDKDI
jgi:hypothetical protein